MPREQTRLRALHRLTNQIYDILFNQEFLDTTIRIRKKLKIDVGRLQEKTNASLAEYFNNVIKAQAPLGGYITEDIFDDHYVVFERSRVLAQFLLEQRVITKFSARALSNCLLLPDSSRFWQVMSEVHKIDWPEDYYFVPYYYVVGGLCFDITEYAKKYNKDEFRDLANRLFSMTKGYRDIRKSHLNSSPQFEGIQEYLYFHSYVCKARIENSLLYKKGYPFRTADGWNNYISGRLEFGQVYLNVTELFLEDIELHWGRIQMAKEAVAAFEVLPIGRPKGIKRSRKSMLGNLTWEEIREQVRENPRTLYRLWNEYVNKLGRLDSTMRRCARDNFYKNVIRHPDLRDLSLETHKRGRPRKSENL